MKKYLLLSVCALCLISCFDITAPSSVTLTPVLPEFISIPLTPGENSVTICCSSVGGPNDIIDGNLNTYWGTKYGSNQYAYDLTDPQAREDFYGPHHVTIDLGMIYENIAKIQYIPIWRWDAPGGYNGSWSGGPEGTVNNGVVTSFEVYLTDEPVQKFKDPPPESRVAYGNWYALESGSNSKITTTTMEFFATFSSARGRYLRFQMLAGYRNHWSSYLSVIAQIAELRVWRTARPWVLSTAGLQETVRQANVYRGSVPRYGYTNAMLNNWVGKAQSYIDDPKGLTWESLDYVQTNLQDFITMAGQRMGMNSYNRFAQKILWADEKGNHLQAHGGGTLWDPVSEKWWFYGEDRTNTTGGGQPGVHGYSSTDLYNWKDEGLALPIFNNTVYDEPYWHEASSVDPKGFPGGWDGNRYNESGWNFSGVTGPHVSGFMWAVNKWRQSLGDWNADGVIDPLGEYYAQGRLTGTDINNVNSYTSNSAGTRLGPLSQTVQDAMWNGIKDYFPDGNPPLYIGASTAAKPYPSSMGLTGAKIAELNDMYRDVPVWRRKQLYRFWNHTTTVERPKVVYNAGTGTHAVTGNPITPYRDTTGTYPYVMFTHIEGGAVGIGYGTAKVLIAVAKNPQGPYKALWAYHTHFVENWTRETSHQGMTRDQSVLIDDDGTAYHFGSTQENRTMGINVLNETYTQIVGVPRYAVGNSQEQMLEEGYDNQMGKYYNLVYGDQREAPAPFLHYTTANMTYEGVVSSTGTITGGANAANKYYYMASSTSTGWFPNPQGVYRTSSPGVKILGRDPHAKPTDGSNYTTSDGTLQNNLLSTAAGSGWIGITGNTYTETGTTSSFFYGTADDGSIVAKGYDGQTTYVQQLRYPAHPWGIVGYRDQAYKDKVKDGTVEVKPEDYPGNPAGYYTALKALFSSTYRRPIYGEQPELDEPRKGKLVYGKYIHMSDSWDSGKNYDARYIWLPMRVLQAGSGANTAAGARARWMQEWRWEDFIYELGPFAGSADAAPSLISDSTGTSTSMWSEAATPKNLRDYYEMLQECFGSSRDWYLNQGKQNPGQNWLGFWFN